MNSLLYAHVYLSVTASDVAQAVGSSKQLKIIDDKWIRQLTTSDSIKDNIVKDVMANLDSSRGGIPIDSVIEHLQKNYTDVRVRKGCNCSLADLGAC